MAAQEQLEEREVLLSIYEGDGKFFDLAANRYQYKVGQNGDSKSFLVDITWSEEYPNVLPELSMEIFYNKHLVPEVKEKILTALKAQAEDLLGYGSTYTIFEYAKENADELLEDQPDIIQPAAPCQAVAPAAVEVVQEKQIKAPKADVLTKNQKRRLYDRHGTKGMTDGKQRGWDWVDVVKHLSQTGIKSDGL